MAFLDEILNIPGASGWLSQLLSGAGNVLPNNVNSPLLGAMNTGGYSVAGKQPSFDDRFPNLPAAGPMPLPPPVNVPALKVAEARPAEPQQVQLPPAAAPAQYQAQPQQQPAPQRGGLGDAFQGFLANAHTGPIGAILGGIAGAAGMGTGNPAQVTYQALLRAGVPEPQARAAAVNPEILKVIAPAYFETKPQLQKVGPDEKLYAVGPQGRAVELASGGPEKPPKGYEWVVPGDTSKGLKAIPGGPGAKLPGNQAGYLAMLEAARPGVESAKQFFLDPKFGQGPINALGQATNSFDIGRARRNIQYAIEGALRIATGAAAPQHEVDRFMGMYAPSVYDSLETRRQKLNALDGFMENATKYMLGGHSAPDHSAGWTDVGGGVRIREKK